MQAQLRVSTAVPPHHVRRLTACDAFSHCQRIEGWMLFGQEGPEGTSSNTITAFIGTFGTIKYFVAENTINQTDKAQWIRPRSRPRPAMRPPSRSRTSQGLAASQRNRTIRRRPPSESHSVAELLSSTNCGTASSATSFNLRPTPKRRCPTCVPTTPSPTRRELT